MFIASSACGCGGGATGGGAAFSPSLAVNGVPAPSLAFTDSGVIGAPAVAPAPVASSKGWPWWLWVFIGYMLWRLYDLTRAGR